MKLFFALINIFLVSSSAFANCFRTPANGSFHPAPGGGTAGGGATTWQQAEINVGSNSLSLYLVEFACYSPCTKRVIFNGNLNFQGKNLNVPGNLYTYFEGDVGVQVDYNPSNSNSVSVRYNDHSQSLHLNMTSGGCQ